MPTVTLCFREAENRSESRSYCPLGIHVEALDNPVDGPLVELPLGDGAGALPAIYSASETDPTTFPGVGIFFIFRDGNSSDEIGAGIFSQINGAPSGTGAPGTVITTPQLAVEAFPTLRFAASFIINCVAGSSCTGLPAPTSLSPPTTPAPPAVLSTTPVEVPPLSIDTEDTISSLTDSKSPLHACMINRSFCSKFHI
jgi:hypothetical protein